MNRIAQYRLLERLDETHGSIVYRGSRDGDGGTVIIKVLKSDSPTVSEIARFRLEYELIGRTDIPGVIRTHDILELEDTLALVLEDFNGIPLKELLAGGTGIDLREFLTIAIDCAQTLGALHTQNIIHRNIKPGTILYNRGSLEVKITDFGIANELTHENSRVYHADVIEGTLAYLSPEQTGRMNRQVDYRTDMYSLGITFYEMLTGKAPFTSKDPLAVMHHHIAILPDTPHAWDAAIPSVLSDIVMKLIAKMPEDRYQNCFGLSHDLKECLARLNEGGLIEPFELGAFDIPPRFTVPGAVYGRDAEIAELRVSLGRMLTGNGASALVLITGDPGIGKSSLIDEVMRSFLPERCYYISGKYNQFRRDVPYSALIQAFRGLVTLILAEENARVERWRGRIIEALGANGRVITDVIPDMELIIGRQPEVPELGPEQNLNRFNFVFGNFVRALATKERPILLFLDDLQWADAASLNLIRLILTEGDVRHCMIIGAFRDNEIDGAHLLPITLDAIGKAGVARPAIRLAELPLESVNMMVSALLRCDGAASRPLAGLVHRKTNGNPFFVYQFMKNLHDEKLLRLDPAAGWSWRMEEIGAMSATDNVVGLLARKISSLPGETREVLKIGACIGGRFSLELAAVMRDTPIEDTFRELQFACTEGLLAIHGDAYCFHHDRIQEAVYSQVTERDREVLHHRIGYRLLESEAADEGSETLLFIVDHLNAGKGLIAEPAERERCARLNLMAGNRAKSSAAFATALIYYSTGIELIDAAGPDGAGTCWDAHYDLALSLFNGACEAAYLNSEYDQMDRYATALIDNVAGPLDSIRAYEIWIASYLARNRLRDAIDTGMKALGAFGVRFPRNPGLPRIALGLAAAMFRMRGRSLRSLAELSVMDDPTAVACMRLIAAISTAIYWHSPNTFPLTIFKMLELTVRYGNMTMSPYAYCAYGLMLCSVGKIDEGYGFGKLGLEVLERLGAVDQAPRVTMMMNSFVRPWKETLRVTEEPLQRSLRTALEIGDFEFAANAAMMLNDHRFFFGMELNGLLGEIVQTASVIRKIKQATQLTVMTILRQSVANIISETTESPLITGEFYSEEEMIPVHREAKDYSTLYALYIMKYIFGYLFREHAMTREILREYKTHEDSQQGLYQFTLYYLFDSLNRMALYDSAGRLERVKTRVRLRQNQKKFKIWMKHNPALFANKYYLVRAERMRAASRVRDAVRCYDLSIRHARKNKIIMEEAIAQECFARFWLGIGNEGYAAIHILAARECFARWGARAKVALLDREFASLMKTAASAGSRRTHGYDQDGAVPEDYASYRVKDILDLSTAMKAARTISGEIDLKKLLEKLMGILIENAGAERGFIMLENEVDGSLTIEARGAIGRDTAVLESIPVAGSDELSAAIVNYVHQSKKNVVLGNAAEEGKFVRDPYIETNKPKSVLCGPIMHKGKVSGILYVENNLATNVFTRDRLELLRLLSSQVAISIENTRLVAHRENEAILKKEMEIAANIQTGLLPRDPAVRNYDVAAYLKPTESVGGDYYDIITAGGRDWLVIGDVSGHGVPAGLIMMMVQTSIHTVLAQHPDIEPSRLLVTVNDVISRNINLLNEDRYMTITVLAVQPDGSMVYSGMHQDMLVYRSAGGIVESFETRGMWIGPMNHVGGEVADDLVNLETGDVLLLYTDGITEAWLKGIDRTTHHHDRDMFGTDRLKDLLAKYGTEPVEAIKSRILKALEGYDCFDDVTMVVIKRLN